MAQALRHQPMRLLAQPSYTGAYDIDQDPLWTHTPQALPIDVLAWYQCDHLGTPLELTDPTGQIAWSAQYKAWGEVKEQRSDWAQRQGLTNPIRFQGQYHDHETGLHYNRYRYYDPRVGRFVSKDPISYAGGLNLYAYAPNPVEWIDPLGLAKCCSRNLVDCEKILSDAGVQVGSHRDMQKAAGGLKDSHHIYQHAAVSTLPKYDYNDAPAVVLQGRNADRTTRGTPHYLASRVQDQKGGGSLVSERRIAYKAIRRAGLSPEEAKCTIMKADSYFSGIGASATSITNIPKRRGR